MRIRFSYILLLVWIATTEIALGQSIVADGRRIAMAGTTSGSGTITGITDASSADIGKLCWVLGQSGGTVINTGTVSSVVAMSSVTCSTHASLKSTNSYAFIATDNTSALRTAISNAASQNTTVSLPAGIIAFGYQKSAPLFPNTTDTPNFPLPSTAKQINIVGQGNRYFSVPDSTNPPLAATVFWITPDYTLNGTGANFIETNSGGLNSGIFEGFAIDDFAESRSEPASGQAQLIKCGPNWTCRNITVNDWFRLNPNGRNYAITAYQLARMEHIVSYFDDVACVAFSTGITFDQPYCGNSTIATLTYTKGDGGTGANPDFGGVVWIGGYLDECTNQTYKNPLGANTLNQYACNLVLGSKDVHFVGVNGYANGRSAGEVYALGVDSTSEVDLRDSYMGMYLPNCAGGGGTWTNGEGSTVATAICTANTTLNAGGTNYAVGDTGTITGGSPAATYQVLTVNSGAVVTYQIINSGRGYSPNMVFTTATGGSQPGTGTGFKINTSMTLATGGWCNQTNCQGSGIYVNAGGILNMSSSVYGSGLTMHYINNQGTIRDLGANKCSQLAGCGGTYLGNPPLATLTHSVTNFVEGVFNTSASTIGQWTPDQQLTVTRIQAVNTGGTITCATPPVLTLGNGTQTQTITLTSGQANWDTGAISKVYSANTLITLTAAASTCSTPPVNLNISILWQSNLSP